MKLGIIGCGNMGSALAKGILSKKVLQFNNIYISDKEAARTRVLHKKFGIVVSGNDELAKKCNVIIVAVKPKDSGKLLDSISAFLDNHKHLVSIMAGQTIKRIESHISKKIAVTRAMPNMAALAGKSITALSHNKAVKDKYLVTRIFSSIGDVMEIEEEHMDAVTAVSGSGPAYFFYVTECLRDAAVKLGIKQDKALKLAVATLTGSGALLDKLDISPAALRESITSKRGTTEVALGVLKSKNLKGQISEAVEAASRRSRELSKGA